MAIFKFIGPDGEERTLNAPEGATQKEANQVFANLVKSEKPKESGFEDFAEGAALPFIETWEGAKGLLGGEVNEERLADWRSDAGESGWGTAGQVAGEVAGLMIPGGALTKAARVAAKAPRLAKALQAMAGGLNTLKGDVALAATAGAVKAPGEGETRLSNSTGEGLASLGGGALQKGLTRAARGIDITGKAKELMDRGVRLTPGQASSNPIWGTLENIMEYFPGVARGVKETRANALLDVNREVMKEALPPGMASEGMALGTAGVQQLKEGFKNAYTAAWKGATGISNNARKKFVDTVTQTGKQFGKKQSNALKRVLSDFKELTRETSEAKLKSMDNDLRKMSGAASRKDYKFKEVIDSLRATLREGMPNDVAAKLQAVDAKYGNFLVARNAVKRALKEEDTIVTSDMLAAAVQKTGKDMVGEGTAPSQGLAAAVAQTVGRGEVGVPLEYYRRLAPGVPGASPGIMQKGGEILTGQTGLQQAIGRKLTPEIEEYLRKRSAAIAAAAYAGG